MEPTICARCKKNAAVIFITKIEGDSSRNEGLCLKCAREMHIKPVDDIIARRLGTGANRIGFSSNGSGSGKEEGHNILSDITPADLRQFGLIPEFVGRFPVTTYVNDLKREDLVRILQEPANSLVRQYSTLLAMDGCDLTFEPEALDEIAYLAIPT